MKQTKIKIQVLVPPARQVSFKNSDTNTDGDFLTRLQKKE
jgi:hypothetical protein